jgi:hypothetical protein
MIDNQLLKKLSGFKKIILFLNASSYKIASIGSWKDAFYKQTDSGALIFNWCLWFSLFKLLTINTGSRLPPNVVTIFLATPLVLHLCIEFAFSADLKLIKENYKEVYANAYYVTYCILAVIGVIFTLYYIFYIW